MDVEVIMTYLYKCQAILWHDHMNGRILSDGKVFTRGMQYNITVHYYWRKIWRDGQFILSLTFINLIYLKSLIRRKFIRIYSLTNPIQITAHTFWKQQNQSGRHWKTIISKQCGIYKLRIMWKEGKKIGREQEKGICGDI